MVDSTELAHIFLPHPKTHAKARLLQWHSLVFYIVLILFLQLGVSLIRGTNSDVLGTSSAVTIAGVIADTNKARSENGLPSLRENKMLDSAAEAKAQNMFAENYWAHYSPSGKDPWSFILSAGYKFAYAGENLAKNYYTSSDVVNAWMNSPSHRENILNSHYQDIGIAVEDGMLQGVQTTLVVQEFGSPLPVAVADTSSTTTTKSAGQPAPTSVPVQISPVQVQTAQPKAVAETEVQPVRPANLNNNIQGVESPKVVGFFDPALFARYFGLVLFFFIAALLLLDYIIIHNRKVYRFSSHHFAHMSLLAISATSLISVHHGEVLSMAVKIIQP